MSEYYNAKRTKNIYDPKSSTAFKLSRSKLELYIECPRCFYLDRRLGIGRPPGFPFTLNSAVDALLKKEFDLLRASKKAHPLMKKYGIDAVPIYHDKLNEWRENFKGVQYHHKPTNLIITGAIDDLRQNSAGEYIVVDYKSTSKNEEIVALDQEWQDGYKVSNAGYFVYCNGKRDMEKFDGKLEFDLTLIAHEGNDEWVEVTINDAHQCLNSDHIPPPGEGCDYCAYTAAVQSAKEKS